MKKEGYPICNLGRYAEGLRGKDNPNWKGGKLPKECAVCHKIFWVKPHHEKTAKYCSHKCKDESQKGQPSQHLLHPNLDPTPELAYILGILKGDGSAFRTKENKYIISLETITNKFNASFEKALKSIGLNPRTYYIKKKNTWATQARSKIFIGWYISLSLGKIREFLSTDKMREAFIRGFYESEGTREKCEMGCIDKELIELVQALLANLGFTPHFRSRVHRWRKEYIMYYVYISRKAEILRFFNEIRPCIKQLPPLALGDKLKIPEPKERLIKGREKMAEERPHQVVDRLLGSFAEGLKSVGANVSKALDEPSKAVSGPEPIHHIPDRILTQAVEAAKTAGEGVEKALSHPVEVAKFPPELPKLPKLPEAPKPPEFKG